VLTAENSGKPLGDRGSVPNVAGGAHRIPPEFLAGGRGLATHSQETHTRSQFSASIFGPSIFPQ